MLNWMRRWFTSDLLIDVLIEQNSFSYCKDMHSIDMPKLNRLGERTWHEKLRGQRRYQVGKIVRFK